MDNQETTIELRELFAIVKKRIWMIILIPLIAAIISGAISYCALTPIYEASTQILVNKSDNQEMMAPSYNDIQYNLRLIDTYKVILTSPRILEVAIEQMNLDLSPGQLSDKIRVSAVQDSQVMAITVEDPDPSMAVAIANGVAFTFQQQIPAIMNVDNAQILAQAKLSENPKPIKPNPPLNIAIAFVVGLMAAVGFAFLLEYLDNTIKTEQDVENILELSTLGIIATFDQSKELKISSIQTPATIGGDRLEA